MDGLIDFRLDADPVVMAGRGSAAEAGVGVGRGEVVWLERRREAPGFTARDRTELARWGAPEHRAVVLDDEPAAFAMLYEGSTPWSSWAVAREDGVLVVWDCVTFADIGRFGCMVDALAALTESDPGKNETSPNVVSFAAERLRRADAERARTRAI